MLAFASMLVKPAKHAGINVPADPEDYNPDEFPSLAPVPVGAVGCAHAEYGLSLAQRPNHCNAPVGTHSYHHGRRTHGHGD